MQVSKFAIVYTAQSGISFNIYSLLCTRFILDAVYPIQQMLPPIGQIANYWEKEIQPQKAKFGTGKQLEYQSLIGRLKLYGSIFCISLQIL